MDPPLASFLSCACSSTTLIFILIRWRTLSDLVGAWLRIHNLKAKSPSLCALTQPKTSTSPPSCRPRLREGNPSRQARILALFARVPSIPPLLYPKNPLDKSVCKLGRFEIILCDISCTSICRPHHRPPSYFHTFPHYCSSCLPARCASASTSAPLLWALLNLFVLVEIWSSRPPIMH